MGVSIARMMITVPTFKFMLRLTLYFLLLFCGCGRSPSHPPPPQISTFQYVMESPCYCLHVIKKLFKHPKILTNRLQNTTSALRRCPITMPSILCLNLLLGSLCTHEDQNEEELDKLFKSFCTELVKISSHPVQENYNCRTAQKQRLVTFLVW